MNLSAVKTYLQSASELNFVLPNGQLVAKHFHVTEVGIIHKHFIDCGGTVREETVANFQLWQADDYDHRLAPQKLLNIIQLSEQTLGMGDHEVEVEYQGETIGKYGLEIGDQGLQLTSKMTDCLARENCGIPPSKQRVSLSDLSLPITSNGGCTPGGGCC